MLFKFKIVLYWIRLHFAAKFESREDIENFQKKRFEKFVFKTLSKSKFYRRFITAKKLNWDAIPQITKTEFMASFDEINTCGLKYENAMQVALKAEHSRDFKNELKGITIGLSTGTSGKRALFLVSKDERAKWVALVMNRVMRPKFFKKQKIAFFLRANSNLYASVKSSLFEFKYFDIFKPIPELLQELQAYKPHIVAGQPSILIEIAEAQIEGVISIQPEQIIAFAEVLHANDKNTIEIIFKIPITEVYQCTEGFLGVSCTQGTMHLNEDCVIIEKEWITDDTFYPIITDFSRHSQAVVKYKLNDVLQIKHEACSCGSPFLAIEKIIGRDDDILLINDIKVFPDLISRRIAMHTDTFQKYALTQTKSNTIEVRIECSDANWEYTRTTFKTALDSVFLDLNISNVEYVFENKIIENQGNKLRKIKRSWIN